MDLTPAAMCDDIGGVGCSEGRHRRCGSGYEWGGRLMPAILVYLNGATSPLEVEFDEAWAEAVLRQRLCAAPRFRPNRSAPPFGLIDVAHS